MSLVVMSPRAREKRLADYHARRRIPLERMPARRGPSCLRAMGAATVVLGLVVLFVRMVWR